LLVRSSTEKLAIGAPIKVVMGTWLMGRKMGLELKVILFPCRSIVM
jgi:hypothetical protein